MEDLVNIKTFHSRHEAELAKGLLDGKGISAVVCVDDVGGSRPSLAFVQGAKLLVRKKDVKKAKEIIKVLETPKRPPTPI